MVVAASDGANASSPGQGDGSSGIMSGDSAGGMLGWLSWRGRDSWCDEGDGDGAVEMADDLSLAMARHSPMLFAGFGSCIFVANKRQHSAQASGALVYDTETAAMSMDRRLPENPYCLFFAAGGGEKKPKK